MITIPLLSLASCAMLCILHIRYQQGGSHNNNMSHSWLGWFIYQAMAVICLTYCLMPLEPKLQYVFSLLKKLLKCLCFQVKKNFPELIRTAYATGEIEIDGVGMIQAATVLKHSSTRTVGVSMRYTMCSSLRL